MTARTESRTATPPGLQPFAPFMHGADGLASSVHSVGCPDGRSARVPADEVAVGLDLEGGDAGCLGLPDGDVTAGVDHDVAVGLYLQVCARVAVGVRVPVRHVAGTVQDEVPVRLHHREVTLVGGTQELVVRGRQRLTGCQRVRSLVGERPRPHGVGLPHRRSARVPADDVAVGLELEGGDALLASCPACRATAVQHDVPVGLHLQVRVAVSGGVRLPVPASGPVGHEVAVGLHLQDEAAVIGHEVLVVGQDLAGGQGVGAEVRRGSDATPAAAASRRSVLRVVNDTPDRTRTRAGQGAVREGVRTCGVVVVRVLLDDVHRRAVHVVDDRDVTRPTGVGFVGSVDDHVAGTYGGDASVRLASHAQTTRGGRPVVDLVGIVDAGEDPGVPAALLVETLCQFDTLPPVRRPPTDVGFAAARSVGARGADVHAVAAEPGASVQQNGRRLSRARHTDHAREGHEQYREQRDDTGSPSLPC